MWIGVRKPAPIIWLPFHQNLRHTDLLHMCGGWIDKTEHDGSKGSIKHVPWRIYTIDSNGFFGAVTVYWVNNNPLFKECQNMNLRSRPQCLLIYQINDMNDQRWLPALPCTPSDSSSESTVEKINKARYKIYGAWSNESSLLITLILQLSMHIALPHRKKSDLHI